MKIMVTGATGFIGSHLVRELVGRGFALTVVARDSARLEALAAAHGLQAVSFDLKALEGAGQVLPEQPEILIHLAWGALDDFASLAHLEEELPAHCHFLKRMVEGGVKRVVVAGTCFEYGMQAGELAEDVNPAPVTSYAMAKDSLRRYLTLLREKGKFSLAWLRYFYMYGPGQTRKALLAQLDAAVERGDAVFPMSGGEQLRDYLPVEEVARLTSLLATDTQADGIYNICSGQPISIRRLAEKRVAELGSGIELDLGHYPYPMYEPLAFWGDRRKMDHFLARGRVHD